MKYLLYKVNVATNQIVVVRLQGRAANVMLLDDPNFINYRNGRKFKYFGGHAKRTPVHLRPPHAGRWNVVVDSGGYPGRVSAQVEVVPG